MVTGGRGARATDAPSGGGDAGRMLRELTSLLDSAAVDGSVVEPVRVLLGHAIHSERVTRTRAANPCAMRCGAKARGFPGRSDGGGIEDVFGRDSNSGLSRERMAMGAGAEDPGRGRGKAVTLRAQRGALSPFRPDLGPGMVLFWVDEAIARLATEG
jgi:hypothetical protein